MSLETIVHAGTRMRSALRCYDTADIGQWGESVGGFYGRSRLAGEAIGTTTVTLTNVVVGSVIRIEVASTGALVELRTADATTEAFTLALYASGDENNSLRIKVRKSSVAPLYKPFETQATLTAASQSVFVAQILD